MLSRFLVLAFSLFLSLLTVPAAAQCKRCEDLGVTGRFSLSGQLWRLHGAQDLCDRDQKFCPSIEPVQITADDKLLALLDRVNLFINFAIAPLDDQKHYGVEEYWTIPTDGKGDCEDYVLDKRRALIAKGIPAGALPIIQVKIITTGEGHVVLGVNTDRGFYILDNRYNDLQTLFSTPDYDYLAIQDTKHFPVFQAVSGVRR